MNIKAGDGACQVVKLKVAKEGKIMLSLWWCSGREEITYQLGFPAL